MGKKKPEMSQVYNQNNEFIFGEKGGRGKHLSAFLKNLSLTSSGASNSPDTYKDVNSNIYGTLAYQGNGSTDRAGSGSDLSGVSNRRHASPQRTLSGPIGASYGHNVRASSPTQSATGSDSSPTRRIAKRTVSYNSHARYADLDDDWDANLNEEELNVTKKPLNEGFGNRMNEPAPFLETLYPDLTISAAVMTSPKTSGTYKESLDMEDMQAKAEITKLNQLNTKFLKIKRVLTESTNINIQELRKLTWNGIPPDVRPITWQILLGYLPTNKSRQSSTLRTKRQEYLDGIKLIESTINFDDNDQKSASSSSVNMNRDKQLYHQIKIDVRRTNPSMKLYSSSQVQKSLRKILYFWAIRHPASGYVQGINDLVTPFYQIFLQNYLWQLQRLKEYKKLRNPEDDDSSLFIPALIDEEGKDEKEQALLDDPALFALSIKNIDLSRISDRVIEILEADTYWCLSRLLDNITDNYIHEQPGIIKQVNDLKSLIAKIDIELVRHFEQEGVEFIQFAFRWMNCLLMRELSIELIIRMWDTYLSETPLGFSTFHVYVCAAFLVKYSKELKAKDFQEILLFLQSPPTSKWTEKDIELMLSEAFIWQSLYKSGGAHLRQ